MANILAKEKQIAVIHALAEGASIRSVERITGVNQNTIMSLGVRVGHACEKIMDEQMRGLGGARFLIFQYEIAGTKFMASCMSRRCIASTLRLHDASTRLVRLRCSASRRDKLRRCESAAGSVYRRSR